MPQAVLVTMFEPSNHVGELGLFIQREKLTPVENAPAGLQGRLYQSPKGWLALLAGVGTANTAVSLTALGMCGRYDLSKALWLISGIGGGDPATTTLGSAVWADWAVDGDLAYEFDPSEVPTSWPTHLIPLGAKLPYSAGAGADGAFGRRYEVFQLNASLSRQAFELTKGIPLYETPELAAARIRYTGPENAAARHTASVQIGASVSSARFWHGHKPTAWAREWVRFWTGGKGVLHTAAMEDTGSLCALRHLSECGLADLNRVLLLRSVSNFSAPPPGVDAITSLTGGEGEASYPGFLPALENGYQAASRVLARWCEEGKL